MEKYVDSVGRILFADDQETFLLATAELLRRDGFEVETAPNSAAAAQLLQSIAFDVLVLDVNMAGNADLEFVTALANTDLDIPVILVTGYPTLKAASEAVGLSVLAFLTKPFDYGLLVQHVRAGVRRSRILSKMAETHTRLKDWDRDLTTVRQSLDATASGESKSATETFVLLSLQTIIAVLADLKQLIDSRTISDAERKAYELLGCPPPLQMLGIIRHTVEVLENTKGAFKSKELGELRLHLEGLLNSAARGNSGSN